MVNHIQEQYELRVKNIIATTNHREPTHIPVLGNVSTWSVGYANAKTDDLLDNLEKMPEATTKWMDDIYVDATLMNGLVVPVRAIQRLGSGSYFVSEDGHTVQHKEHCVMQENEYHDLFENPMDFLINVLGKRKFTSLNGTQPEARQVLIDVMLYLLDFSKANIACSNYAKEKYGVPSIISGKKVYPTMDVIFDRLRGFSGTMIDVRRQRDNLLRATEVLNPLYEKLIGGASEEFPFAIDTLHCPTFLKLKDFEEIFWPTMKEYLIKVHNNGSKTIVFMEGEWKKFFELMTFELPQSSIVCLLESDDIVEAKKAIGQQFTIAGGVNTNFLRYKSKQECIDEAKRIIDECAPGGGFIFSLEKTMCTLGDVNIENLIAVNQFVHEYGKY